MNYFKIRDYKISYFFSENRLTTSALFDIINTR